MATLCEELTPTLRKAIDLATRPGASSWLTSPLKEHGFSLHKGAALALAGPFQGLHQLVYAEPGLLWITCFLASAGIPIFEAQRN